MITGRLSKAARARWIAVEPRQADCRLLDEAAKMAGIVEAPGARIGGVDRELRRHQHRVQARLRHLPRHLLAAMHDALEAGDVAVEVDDHHRRQRGIEPARDMQQHAAVAVGGVLPIDAAARRGVPAPAVLLDVEEGLVLPGRLAASRGTASCRRRRARSSPRSVCAACAGRCMAGLMATTASDQAREQMATHGAAHVTPAALAGAARAATAPQRSRGSPAGRRSR